MIPGPSSTELAILIGYRRAGWVGLLLAGVCFILPAALMVSAIAWAYVRYGHLPRVEGILYGVKPVVVAVIVQALWNLGRVAVKTRLLAAVGVAATLAALLGASPLLTLFATGLFVGGPSARERAPKGEPCSSDRPRGRDRNPCRSNR